MLNFEEGFERKKCKSVEVSSENLLHMQDQRTSWAWSAARRTAEVCWFMPASEDKAAFTEISTRQPL